jgi:hypothetical protein
MSDTSKSETSEMNSTPDPTVASVTGWERAHTCLIMPMSSGTPIVPWEEREITVYPTLPSYPIWIRYDAERFLVHRAFTLQWSSLRKKMSQDGMRLPIDPVQDARGCFLFSPGPLVETSEIVLAVSLVNHRTELAGTVFYAGIGCALPDVDDPSRPSAGDLCLPPNCQACKANNVGRMLQSVWGTDEHARRNVEARRLISTAAAEPRLDAAIDHLISQSRGPRYR